LPHSKQFAFNRDVINPQDGHILCDPYPVTCGFSLRSQKSSRIVNSTIRRPREILAMPIKATLLGESCIKPNEQTTHSQKSLRVGELQMDWLRSEDLKEAKNVTAPIVIIAVHPHCRCQRVAVRTIGMHQINPEYFGDDPSYHSVPPDVLREEPEEEEEEDEKEHDSEEDDDGDEGYSE
jgi:hypothetical protein